MVSDEAKIVIMYTSFSCLQLLMSPWRSHQVPAWYGMTTGIGKLLQIVGDGDVMVSSSCYLTHLESVEGCQDQLGLKGYLWEIVLIINWCGKTQSAAGGTIPWA